MARFTAYHGSGIDLSQAVFDLSKFSPTAVWGPGLYLTPDAEEAFKWGKTAAAARGLPTVYLNEVTVETPSSRYIDITQPVTEEIYLRLDEALGRHVSRSGTFPFISFERRYGSVADGMRALGFDVLVHRLNEGRPKHYLVARPEAIKQVSIQSTRGS
jgi:hypothetical protein